ncbi:translation factor GTPase family protein [Streptomyces sp. NPDC003077]|uniref:translation factor GTPase family protein n=1 Tax=Streptomyces sp. NPDC003077 TaxID=3154443 RepID=UPI00339F8077
MRTLNLGILAHVDAGKTSLTERLLHAAGVIDEIGSVDDGNTQTDSLALERQRGITIKSAVVSFPLDDITVNLIDTPGHPDFIAEVERVLSVLDGAVLVVSAVEGVQAQTRVLMRTLRRLRIPTLLFVNKVDRRGARYDEVLRGISDRLTPAVIPMGTVHGRETEPEPGREIGWGPGTAASGSAHYLPYTAADAVFTSALAEVLAEHDEALLAAYVDDETLIPYSALRAALVAQTRRALVHPVFFGSAVTGTGVDALVDGIRELLPAVEGDAGGQVSGTVFKVERGPAGEKVAYVRMWSGAVRTRDRLRFRRGGGESGEKNGKEVAGADRLGGPGASTRKSAGTKKRAAKRAGEERVTAIGVFRRGALAEPSGSVVAGQIGKLWGLGDVRIGDEIGKGINEGTGEGTGEKTGEEIAEVIGGRGGAPRTAKGERRHFAPPTLETVVVPRDPAQKGALHAALTQLAEQDPLINLRQDEIRGEVSVSLYGEVQKEVIQATLANDFGMDVAFRATTTLCVERPIGTGAAVEVIAKDPNPFLATVGLRVDPAPPGAGVSFRLEVELGSMPFSFFRAVEETVKEALRQGMHGWEVIDCTVTMTHSGYWARQSHSGGVFDRSMSSTAGDFRNLTPLVLFSALRHAGTRVYEPLHRFRLELPADALGAVTPVLARLRAVPGAPVPRGAECTLEGEIPAARVHELERLLPSLTRGEGLLESAFDRYQPVSGTPPSRPRTDHNPLDREEYLLRVVRRVRGGAGG